MFIAVYTTIITMMIIFSFLFIFCIESTVNVYIYSVN